MQPNELTTLRNKIHSLLGMGAVRSAYKQQAKLAELVEQAGDDHRAWVIRTLFGLDGTQEQLDDLLRDRRA